MIFQVVEPKEARQLNRAFVDKYAKKSLPQYRTVMGHGEFYGAIGHQGVMWEAVRPYKILSEKRAFELLNTFGEIFVMWDRPLKSNSRKLQKSRMLKISGCDFSDVMENRNGRLEGFGFLPANVYVFDEDVSFFLIFTNADIRGFGRVCLTSLELSDYGISPAFQRFFEELEFGKG